MARRCRRFTSRAEAGVKRVGKVLAFALLGVATGALAAAALVLAGHLGDLLYVIVPGLIFGVVFGPALWLGHLIGPGRAVIYAGAAAISHAAAFFAMVRLAWLLHRLFGRSDLFTVFADRPALVLSGIVAGALGGGLLGVVTRALAPIRRWPLLGAAGAPLGAFLPIAINGHERGLFGFYMLWQGGYAACSALILPRRETLQSP
jgi:hypothetical protein